MPSWARLTNGSSTTSFVSASVNPTPGRAIAVWVEGYIATGSTPPSQPTVTGNGITYTLEDSVTVDGTGTDQSVLWLFRGKLPSTSAGAITFSFSGVVPTRCSWIVDEGSSDIDSGGANAANAFVQVTKNRATSASTVTTLAVNFVGSMTSGNGAYFGCGIENNNSQTQEAGWTQPGASEIGTTLVGLSSQYLTTGTDTGTATTWTTAARAGAILVEIAYAAPPAPGDTSEPKFYTPGFMSTASFPRFLTAIAAPFLRSEVPFWGIPTPALPGPIAGVEPEAQGDNQVWKDGNDALYRVMESDLASGNHPMMMKSTDGGITWNEVDSGNRPTAQDLEAVWSIQVGTQVIVGINRDDTVWRDVFNTSDAGGSADTWGTQETVATGLSSTGVEQYVSIARTSDGQEWWFYSSTLASTNQQWGYKRRTAVNTYSSETDGGGSTSVSYTAPVSVVGASDLTHVFYTDVTNAHLYYKTLSSGGTLSSATQVDSAGTSGFSASPSRYVHTNAVYYSDAGTEVISVLYADTTQTLKLVRIVGGTPATVETVSLASVMTNPSATTSDAIVAHLAIDGTTLLAIWSDGNTGDLYMRRRAADGTWDPVVNLWASGGNFAMYAYNRVFTRGGRRIMGYAYDVGDHPNDISNMRYNELDLGAAAPADLTVDQTDSVGLTDIAALTVSPVFTDSAGLTDSALVELSKLVAQTDSAGLTDAVALTIAPVLTDSAGLTDATELAQSKVLTDSAGLTDTSNIASGKTVDQTDSVGLTDSQAFSQMYVLTDSAGLTDTTGLAVNKVLTDSTGLTDSILIGLQKDVTATDSAGLTDAAILVRTAVLTDLIGLADATAFDQLRTLTDSAGLTDVATVSLTGPAAGITTRPNTGSTTRPSSGITTRPNSGITVRP